MALLLTLGLLPGHSRASSDHSSTVISERTESEGVLGFHNPLLNRSLISFWLFGNWFDGSTLLPSAGSGQAPQASSLQVGFDWVCISYLVLRIAYRAGGLGLNWVCFA